jgi:polysaccharide biosynthesis/export protein
MDRAKHSKIAFCAVLLATALSGCALNNAIPTSGPSAQALQKDNDARFDVVTLDAASMAQLRAEATNVGMEVLPPASPFLDRITAGDTVEVLIMEAQPATLYGMVGDTASAAQGRGGINLPAQVVAGDGTITVPFAGRVAAAGASAQVLEDRIRKQLAGKANQPQILVRATSNVAQEVSVVGEVRASRRVPLSAKGERLLDVLAAAGGATVPLDKATVQITRGGVVATAPLDRIVTEPRQNVQLTADDVVAVYFQRKSFVALGAVNKAGEVPFEATGLSLAQAMGRAGGLVDSRSDASGIFVARQHDGKPVVYRLDLSNPASIFAMREFQMQDRDIVYVANSSGAELQKFLNLLGSAVYPFDVARNFGAF